MSALVVLTAVGSEEQGELIASELVVRRQAACVNRIAGVTSVYRWQGELCRDDEHLLIIKTNAEAYDDVVATIQELHSYDVPEILAFDVARGERHYLEWISASLEE